MTQSIFLSMIGFLAVQRIFELRTSQRNEARLKTLKGREHSPRHYGFMKAMHLAWFFSMVSEVFILKRPFIPGLAAGALLLFSAGQALRLAAIKTLGPRWTVKIITLPGTAPVSNGIYRYIRHPNYLGVMLEILAVPLLHTAFLTATIFSVLNAAVLTVRIKAEEQALRESSGQPAVDEHKPRFFPSPQVFTKLLKR